MSGQVYTNQGTITATAIVSLDPDRSGNFWGDSVADDVEIQAAMEYVGALGGGIVHLINATFWTVAALIPNYTGITLQGENMDTTIIRATAESTHNIIEKTEGDAIYFFNIRDLEVQGTNTPGCGNGIHFTGSINDPSIERVRASYCNDGLHGLAWGGKVYRLVAEHNLNDGILVTGQQTHLIACYSADNDQDGISVQTQTFIIACRSDVNGRYGLKLSSDEKQVIGGYLANNFLI